MRAEGKGAGRHLPYAKDDATEPLQPCKRVRGGFFQDFFWKAEGRKRMEETMRVALISIVVEDMTASERLNSVLHDFSQYIIGRMGIPYPKRGIALISVAIDAPQDVISALSGKLGMIRGVSTKTIFSKLPEGQKA